MIDLRIKDLFFDRHVVMRAVDKAKREVLSRAGAFVRQTAKTSIRKRKGTSPPGQPPYSHVGLVRDLILFGYDRSSDSVVVGPVGLRNKGAQAPNTLEFGGTATRTRFEHGRIARRRVRVRKRPFMGPALDREIPRLPKLWAGSVRGG
jgi:hypothetical protein